MMKQHRKWLDLALVGAITLTLAACGQSSAESQSQETQPSAVQESNNTTSTPDASAPTGDGNVLVVYYSASGNTEAVAGYIAEAAGGDLFAITLAEPYTRDDLN